MNHLLVTEAGLLQSQPIVGDLASIYTSEYTFNNWTTVCVQYDPNTNSQEYSNLVSVFTTLTLVQFLSCADCESCPKTLTFRIKLDKWKLALRVNSSYEVNYQLTFLNGQFSIEKQVLNGATDPIKFFVRNSLDSFMFYSRWNSISIRGYKEMFLRIIKHSLKNPHQYMTTDKIFQLIYAKETTIKGIKPFEMKNVSIHHEA